MMSHSACALARTTGTAKTTAISATARCKQNADCEAKDDANLCNGTWYCDKSLAVADCRFNPASAVLCAENGDTDCLANTCDPKIGACAMKLTGLQATCDDGNVCTVATKCDATGACTGQAKTCNDDDPCTDDACSPTNGCVHLANTALCDDGKQCTEKDRCKLGKCAGAALQCDDGNSCTSDACDEKFGKCSLAQKAEGASCDADGDGCTVNDACTKGACKVGKPVLCHNPVQKSGRSVTPHGLALLTDASMVVAGVSKATGKAPSG